MPDLILTYHHWDPLPFSGRKFRRSYFTYHSLQKWKYYYIFQGQWVKSSWWRHQTKAFFALLALCEGIHPSPLNSPHKGQWRGALMFFFICAWTNGWVNNRDDGALRRHCVHYDVTVMMLTTEVTRGFVFSIKIWKLRKLSGRPSNLISLSSWFNMPV